MAKWLAGLVLLFATVLGALYYWLYRPLDEETAGLRSRIAELEAGNRELQKTDESLQKRVTEKESELTALHSTQDGLVNELKHEIASKQIEVERFKNELHVDMVDEILFDSGEAVLKSGGVALLKRIGAVLKKDQNREIEIQGHTDNVPIKKPLAKKFATNWELSATRATNVVRYLEEEAHLNPARLSAKAFSMNRPRASNRTAEGRRKNRRIEIILTPLLPALPADK